MIRNLPLFRVALEADTRFGPNGSVLCKNGYISISKLIKN